MDATSNVDKIVIPVRTISRMARHNSPPKTGNKKAVDKDLELKIEDSIKRITSLKGPNFLNDQEAGKFDNLIKSSSDLSLKSNGIESLSSEGSNKLDTAFSPSRFFADDIKGSGLKVLESDFLQAAMEGNFVIPKRKSSANINSAGSTLHNLAYEPPVPPLDEKLNQGFKTFTQSNESVGYKTFTQLPVETESENQSVADSVPVMATVEEAQPAKIEIDSIEMLKNALANSGSLESNVNQTPSVADDDAKVSEVEQESIISFSNATSASATENTGAKEGKHNVVIPSRKESLALNPTSPVSTPVASAIPVSPTKSPLSNSIATRNSTSPVVTPASSPVVNQETPNSIETSNIKQTPSVLLDDETRPFSFASSANFHVNTNMVNRHPLEPRLMPGYEDANRNSLPTSPIQVYQNRNQPLVQSHLSHVVSANENDTEDIQTTVAIVTPEAHTVQNTGAANNANPPVPNIQIQEEKVSSIYSKSRKMLNNLMAKAEGVEVSKLLFGKKGEAKQEDNHSTKDPQSYNGAVPAQMIPIQDISQLPPGAVPVQPLNPIPPNYVPPHVIHPTHVSPAVFQPVQPVLYNHPPLGVLQMQPQGASVNPIPVRTVAPGVQPYYPYSPNPYTMAGQNSVPIVPHSIAHPVYPNTIPVVPQHIPDNIKYVTQQPGVPIQNRPTMPIQPRPGMVPIINHPDGNQYQIGPDGQLIRVILKSPIPKMPEPLPIHQVHASEEEKDIAADIKRIDSIALSTVEVNQVLEQTDTQQESEAATQIEKLEIRKVPKLNIVEKNLPELPPE